ncbi:hypothetical protein C347_02806 [Cryptococcus neoformans AD2-60a]|nr:hypothetical protein C347_02806 [Cryptococcus neoformans var. grubii AD2-60a]OXC85184.1 hypothetical protein C344_02500 [Cryptococcus neoformans var. grubii AD1-7a]OXG33493.1 hypothetical protein C360_03223 [Cryptococcus neoformans var. grubii Bt15]OXG42643.1 hypothetical protein C359_01966 [Cryptococcus neoformans var. grubii Bt120]OXH34231.1 hypothetical protein J005_02581 [Cryptococcus neoformans var. grubii]
MATHSWTHVPYHDVEGQPQMFQPQPQHRRLVHPNSQWSHVHPSRTAGHDNSHAHPHSHSHPYPDVHPSVRTHPAACYQARISVDAFAGPDAEEDELENEPELLDPALAPQSTIADVKKKGKTPATRARSRSVASATSLGTDAASSEEATFMFFPNPSQPPIQLKGARKTGLLPAPAGSILEVNDLLILHPPEKNRPGFGGHNSQWEMYTCRVCSKTYDGKNARSVARRHLQDKHGVPLSVQARRSRWDCDPNRPRNKSDAKERNLKSKRDWASKNRQQSKLEKTHCEFLEQFGPKGLVTSCGMRLVASKYRGAAGVAAALQKNEDFFNGEYGKVIIPEEILAGVRAIREYESSIQQKGENPAVQQEEELEMKGAGSLPLPSLSASASTRSAKSRGNSLSRLPTPPHVLMPAFTVSPRSPHEVAQPNSYHHSIYTRQLEFLRQQHAYKPYTFADVPMVDQEMEFLYMTPIQHGPQPQSTFQHRTVHQHSQVEFSRFHVQDFPGLKVAEEETQADTEELSQIAQVNQSSAEPEGEHEIATTTENGELGEGANDWVEADNREDKTEKDADLEAEVAAEGLLNLHSTPLRASEDEVTFKLPSHATSRPTPPVWKLLDAPPIVSPTRSRHTRAKSFIQPFKDPRPEATRSLSFEQVPAFDDPFMLNGDTPNRPTSISVLSTRSRTTLLSSRMSDNHKSTMPSPSPLSSTRRKRKAPPSSPFAPPPSQGSNLVTRPALRPLSTNFSSSNRSGSGSAAATPIRSALTPHIPSSLTRAWLLSSPSNGDAAASLGLVPTHLAPATPGMMRGIIGTDTPGMTLLDAREKVKKEKGSESEKEKERLEEKDMKERRTGITVLM